MWYRQTAPLPSCKVGSLETRIVNIHVFIYRLWCFTEASWHIFTFFVTFRSLAVVQHLGISTRGWLGFNCVFRFGGHKCTQFLSGLKKIVFPVLYPYDIRHHSWVKNQVRMRNCLYKVCGWLRGVVNRGTMRVRLLKSLRSSSFSSFLHGTTISTRKNLRNYYNAWIVSHSFILFFQILTNGSILQETIILQGAYTIYQYWYLIPVLVNTLYMLK